MKSLNKHAWKIITAVGFLFIGWGIHQMFVIPTIGADHWAWLTSDPETIEYFKFWFRTHGIWTAANGLFIALVAATAFKHGERWAWSVLAYLPVHIILLTTQFPWLFFITILLLGLAVWSLWISRDNLLPASTSGRKFGWIFFIILGLAFLYYAYINLFVFPALDPRDPELGWAWLTTDSEVIDYIKFYFRVFGVRVLAFGMLTLLTAATGLRSGSRRAWGILFIMPILVGVHIIIWPWTALILMAMILFAGVGLWLSFPKEEKMSYE
ncbi:MAG: hypothetical protein N2D54_05280 [Chloroflexota bacterium]